MGGAEEEKIGQPPLKRVRLDHSCASAIADLSLGPRLSYPPPKDSILSGLENSQRFSGSALPGMAGFTSGSTVGDERIGSKGQIKKAEFVRLIEQALVSLGYTKAAELLESESKVSLQSDVVTEFRNGILEGNFDSCCQLLENMSLEEGPRKSAQFLLLQQKFLELLERSETARALKVLRSELAPMGIKTQQVHSLASWVMCTSPKDLQAKARWSGAQGNSRFLLLEHIQSLLPPWLMVPERRLENLVEQALQTQRAACLFHNTSEAAFSLFHDHCCGRDQIPTRTVQVLENHSDEVWYLQFSNNGRYLASASKDQRVIVWEVKEGEEAKVQHVLEGHTQPLSFVAWSPDDQLLLTCSNDKLLKLWDAASGECRQTFSKHTQSVTACAWFPDGRRFVSGGLDKVIYKWDIGAGDAPVELDPWGKDLQKARIHDLAISQDGRHMVSICNECEIRIYGFETQEVRVLVEAVSMTSLCLSRDGRCLLVNLSSKEIHLWDISPCTTPKGPLHTYKGQKQGRFVIRSCFGGSDQDFIVSGSEDSQVYIWHRGNGELLEVLAGHLGTVNAVSWNPAHPHMFASASDDRTVRLWGLAPGSSRL